MCTLQHEKSQVVAAAGPAQPPPRGPSHTRQPPVSPMPWPQTCTRCVLPGGDGRRSGAISGDTGLPSPWPASLPGGVLRGPGCVRPSSSVPRCSTLRSGWPPALCFSSLLAGSGAFPAPHQGKAVHGPARPLRPAAPLALEQGGERRAASEQQGEFGTHGARSCGQPSLCECSPLFSSRYRA